MKPFLLHRNTDFDWARPAPWNTSALTQDLDLATLLDTMARNDPYLRDVAGRVILAGLDDPAAISVPAGRAARLPDPPVGGQAALSTRRRHRRRREEAPSLRVHSLAELRPAPIGRDPANSC